MSTPTIHRTREFHEKFGHPIADVIQCPVAERRLLRYRLLMEEVLEFGRAIGVSGLCELSDAEFETLVKKYLDCQFINPGREVDLAGAADALGDIDYVTQGANLEFGFPAEAVLAEIHRANMSKLGADGLPIYDEHGKVRKGPNYVPPNVQAVLAAHSPSQAQVDSATAQIAATDAAPRLTDDPADSASID